MQVPTAQVATREPPASQAGRQAPRYKCQTTLVRTRRGGELDPAQVDHQAQEFCTSGADALCGARGRKDKPPPPRRLPVSQADCDLFILRVPTLQGKGGSQPIQMTKEGPGGSRTGRRTASQRRKESHQKASRKAKGTMCCAINQWNSLLPHPQWPLLPAASVTGSHTAA